MSKKEGEEMKAERKMLSQNFGLGIELDSFRSSEKIPGQGMMTDPTKWYLNVNGKMISLSTNDLVSQKRFARACVDQASIFPNRIPQTKWVELINALMKSTGDFKPK